MQVYSAFLKIIKSNLFMSIIYMGIFLILTLVLSNTAVSEDNMQFKEKSVSIAIDNQDGENDLVKSIIEVVSNDNKVITLKDTTESKKDALFFREVEYILIIPKGFTESFMKDGIVTLENLCVADSNASLYINAKIDSYLNSVRLYENQLKTEKSFVKKIEFAKESIQQQVDTELYQESNLSTKKTAMDYFFSYSSYILIAIILFCVSFFIMKFNKENVRKRTACAPIKRRKINTQLFICIALYSLVIYSIIALLGFILYPNEIVTMKGLLNLINMFVYTIFCTILAFVVGNVIKSDAALNGITNTLSLSFAFLGGSFVPQALLGDSVKLLGSFTPNFWFIKSCDEITKLPYYTIDTLLPIFQNMAVIIGFAIVLGILSLIITKQRKVNH